MSRRGRRARAVSGFIGDSDGDRVNTTSLGFGVSPPNQRGELQRYDFGSRVGTDLAGQDLWRLKTTGTLSGERGTLCYGGLVMAALVFLLKLLL